VSEDSAINIKLYKDQQEVDNEITDNSVYYIVQVFRASQDLLVWSREGGNPRWENFASTYNFFEAEEKYFEAKETYVKVRLIEQTREVIRSD